MGFNLRQRAEYLECVEKLTPFNTTIRDAVNFYLPHLQATTRSCTAKQLVDEIVSAKKADGVSHRYIEDLKSRLNQFAVAFDGTPIAKITNTHIDQWLRSLTNLNGTRVSPVTRNNFRRILHVAFNFARDHGYCTDNPVVKTAKAKVIESPAGILTVEEMSRLLNSASEKLIASGARQGFLRVLSAPLRPEHEKPHPLRSQAGRHEQPTSRGGQGPPRFCEKLQTHRAAA
jgi:site-specific recombinase XerD